MEIQELYDLIESHLDNEIEHDQKKNMKTKRVKLPIPKEYGGGVVTGYGYEETIKNLICRLQKQIKMEVKSPLFEECWSEWIKIKEGQTRSPSTISNYRYIANVHLLPFFGKRPISEITPDDIQIFFNGIMHLSKSVSNQSTAILSGIFDRAVRIGDISHNIMLYKYEKSTKHGEKTVLQDSDLIFVINELNKLKGSKDTKDYLYCCFLCFTSLRRGEILGLKWKDIDFEKREIIVRNNVTFPSGQNNPVVREPKDKSYGIIYLQSELSRRLEEYGRNKNEYIFPYSFKKATEPMTRSMFIKMWNRITKTIDLKGATSHSFRSSYATMLTAHCDHIDPKVLQGALRHKTPDLAIKVYAKENFSKTRIAEKEYDEWMQKQLADKTSS